MAEHLWFIPVSAGVGDPPIAANMCSDSYLNVQWSQHPYPAGVTAATALVRVTSEFLPQGVPPTPSGHASSALLNCFGRWYWQSFGCGNDMTLGTQLHVGTVFGANLCEEKFAEADIYAKFSRLLRQPAYRLAASAA